MPKTVLCPTCGTENPASAIITVCKQCKGSLTGAKPVVASSDVTPYGAPPVSRPLPASGRLKRTVVAGLNGFGTNSKSRNAGSSRSRSVTTVTTFPRGRASVYSCGPSGTRAPRTSTLHVPASGSRTV